MARELANMSASAINRELDRLDKIGEAYTRRMIDDGRGHERYSETREKTDPLALAIKENDDRRDELRREVARRYGPGAPSRLPTSKRTSTRAKVEPLSSADLIDLFVQAVKVSPDVGQFTISVLGVSYARPRAGGRLPGEQVSVVTPGIRRR